MNTLTFKALLRRLYLIASELHWGILLGIVLVHMAISFALLSLAGEADLTGPVTYIYWYATTALTVGYGDLSPKSDLGRMAAAFFIMPGAIACFTAAIAKALNDVAVIWRQKRIGLGDFSDMKNMIVLVGYDADRTPQMIDEIVADTKGKSELVLYTRKQIDNIDPRYRYVHASSLTSKADMLRAGIPDASKIVIYTPTDDEAIAAGLAVSVLNKSAHIVAYFRERSNADLLHSHCPNIETVLTPSVELLVKSLSDPGSSQLITELASHTDDGATLYAAHAAQAGSFADMSDILRKHHAVLVAFAKEGAREMHFDFEGVIEKGDKLFYVARHRLPAAWA
jgi:voltage-gated potassium channel